MVRVQSNQLTTSRTPAVSPLGVVHKSALRVLVRALSLDCPLRGRPAGPGLPQWRGCTLSLELTRSREAFCRPLRKPPVLPAPVRLRSARSPARRPSRGGGPAHLSNCWTHPPPILLPRPNLAADDAVSETFSDPGAKDPRLGSHVVMRSARQRLRLGPEIQSRTGRGRGRCPRRRHRMCRPAVPLRAAAQPATLRNRPRKQGT